MGALCSFLGSWCLPLCLRSKSRLGPTGGPLPEYAFVKRQDIWGWDAVDWLRMVILRRLSFNETNFPKQGRRQLWDALIAEP